MDIEKLEKEIKPYILRGRPGDWEHSRRVAQWTIKLGKERDDLFILVTAAYIHDIGWRDLINQDKMTLDKLLELEPQANRNSEPFIKEVLRELNYSSSDIQKVLRLVEAVDKYVANSEDEAIVVDADTLSKLNMDHLKEKYQSSEWKRMYELWQEKIPTHITTQKAKKLYPELLENLKKSLK